MGTYRAADGHLNIAAPGRAVLATGCATCSTTPRCAADERFATPQLRYDNRVELDVELDERFGTRTRDEWIALLDAAGIPCGPVNAIDEVFADPQVQHLAMLATVDHADPGPGRRAAQPDHDVAQRARRADGGADAGRRSGRGARRPRDPARRTDQSGGRWRRRFVSPRRFFESRRRCCAPRDGFVGRRGGGGGSIAVGDEVGEALHRRLPVAQLRAPLGRGRR